MSVQLSVVITTYNRGDALKKTLLGLREMNRGQNHEIIVYNDASTDETRLILAQFKEIKVIHGINNIGLIAARNILMQEAQGDFVLSIDDDSNIINNDFHAVIINHFESNPKCAVIAARIFWGKVLPEDFNAVGESCQVQSFVGCGHVWRKKAWDDIPPYPEWFQFYGEENYASNKLFKKGWEVHYLPDLLVHHRVEIKSRENDSDYLIRSRRSLRSGWYLIFIFYPLNKIPRRLLYSIWMQLKNKAFKGNFKVFGIILLSLYDMIFNFPKLLKSRDSFSKAQFHEYSLVQRTKIYWNPEDD